MDKVLSARVDESVIRRLNQISRKLGMTKKAIIEGAVLRYADELEATEGGVDVLKETFGTWDRQESTATTVARGRRAFSDSMTRRKK